MNIVAVVPIKLNNERLPGKNTLMLGGMPLVQHILNTLLDVKGINERYVYCSQDSISEYLPTGVTFLKRDSGLDEPNTNFTQIFEAFMDSVKADIYVYAHATAPFVKAETIRKEIDAVMSGEFDSAFCAQVMQDFLWKDGNAINFDASNIPRSQDLPIIYRETSGVYVFRAEVFRKMKRRIGNHPYIVEISKRESVDINTYEDFRLAELMLDWEG